MATTNKIRSKKGIVPSWLYYGEVFAEPIIIAFAAFLLFDHIKHIWDTSPTFDVFWNGISEYSWKNVVISLTFLVAFLIWAGFTVRLACGR